MVDRDRYPLEPVRAVRRAEDEAARQALADRRQALARARDRLAQATAALEAHHAETRRASDADAPTEPRTGDAWRRRAAFRDRRRREAEGLARRVTEARWAVTDAARAAERAQRALAEAHQRSEVVESHRERWAEGRRLARETRAQDELDDRPGRER